MGHFSGVLRLGLLASVLLVPKGNGIPTTTTTPDGNDQEALQALPKEVLRQVIEMANITSRIFQSKAPMGESDLTGRGTHGNISVPGTVQSSATAAAAAAAAADWSVIQRLLLSLWEAEAEKTLLKKELLELKAEIAKIKEENSKKTKEEEGMKKEGFPPNPVHHWHHHPPPPTPLSPLSSGVRMSPDDSPSTSCSQFQETQETILKEIWDFKVHGINCNKLPKEIETQKTPVMPGNCHEIFHWGERKSGVYTIYPQKDADPDGVDVWCDMGESESHDEADLGMEMGEGGAGRGWTVIIKRQPVPNPVNFTRDWNTYKLGFGEPQTEYYIGNDNLHALTSGGRPQALRVEITDWDGVSKYASYGSFSVASELDNFRLSVGNFSSTRSTAGDSLTQGSTSEIANGMPFSTIDRDNDKYSSSCAKMYKSGFWFNSCHYATPTNPLLGKRKSVDGMNWRTFYDDTTTMQFMTFKIRPSDLPGI